MSRGEGRAKLRRGGREGMRFLGAALTLGGLALWASENLFWFMPPPDWTPAAFGLTWLLYSAAAASALALIGRTGMGGLGAAFLGGALLGYLVEGAAAATIYDAFPLQLVWTPLAWHGLVTGGIVLGLGRLAGRLGPVRMAGIWLAFGLAGGLWGIWWPIERGAPVGGDALLGYLVALGLLVPLAQVSLDRLGRVPRPARSVQMLAPAAFALSWAVQTVITQNPLRLVLPPILCGLWLIAGRLGNSGGEVSFGLPARRSWHHGLFVISLATMLAVVQAGWANLEPLATNVPIALATGLGGLVWLGRLGWLAARRAAPAD